LLAGRDGTLGFPWKVVSRGMYQTLHLHRAWIHGSMTLSRLCLPVIANRKCQIGNYW
jgi:hypothetical protein